MSSQPMSSISGAMNGLRIAAPQAPAHGHADERAQRFDDAVRFMQEGCWHTAFIELSELADGGHPQAARIALLFVRRGTSLFGGSFHASDSQRHNWQRVSD
ncbi:MAG TPA: hypothetical protein VF169_05555 [Albitalea sp.]|uniref:hypothetical protein n=1 Tax=Piscinibacter sp. TaxID=1903157 RepID=UPI002ED48A04